MLCEHRQSPAAMLLVRFSNGFACSDSRDKISALLGILPDDPDRPKEDYNLEMREVHQQFAKYSSELGWVISS